MVQGRTGSAHLPERVGVPAARLRAGRSDVRLTAEDLLILPGHGPAPHPVVLALHGRGMTAPPFARWLKPLFDEPWSWLIPEGPYPMEERVGGIPAIGHAWYMWNGDTPAFRASLRESERYLLELLAARAAEHSLDTGRVILLGFSQGGYLGGSLALRHAERFRGLAVAGGRVRPPYAERPLAEVPRLPVLFLHGRDDAIVPAPAARESAEELRGHGFPVTFTEVDGGHAWGPAMGEAFRAWARSIL